MRWPARGVQFAVNVKRFGAYVSTFIEPYARGTAFPVWHTVPEVSLIADTA
jgi:hypothetical protein